MNSKFKNKLLDIFNSSFTGNSIRKSQNNIFTDNSLFIKKRIENSSSPTYQRNNSFTYQRFNKKDNIKEMLNKSLHDLGINLQKNTNKKTYFDDIQTSLNKKRFVQNEDFDYEEYFSKINEKKRKKSFNDLLNANNDLLNNNTRNNINKNHIYKNYSNNGNLLKKISAFATENKIDNPLLGKVKNKQTINFDNDESLSIRQFNKLNQGRLLNLQKENYTYKNYNNILSTHNLNSYNKNNIFSSNYQYIKPQSLKSSGNNSKIYIKDERDKIIDNFMFKNGGNQRNYFSSHQRKNGSKSLNFNF
jgi:hypothetical protein